MQGDLFEGYPIWAWKVVEIQYGKEIYIDPDTGETHRMVVYCKTVPIEPTYDYPY